MSVPRKTVLARMPPEMRAAVETETERMIAEEIKKSARCVARSKRK